MSFRLKNFSLYFDSFFILARKSANKYSDPVTMRIVFTGTGAKIVESAS